MSISGGYLRKAKVSQSRHDRVFMLDFSAAYVALSRATSLDGLQVLGFQPDKCVSVPLNLQLRLQCCIHRIEAHPRVIEWMREVTGEEVPSPAADLPKVEPEGDSDDDHQYWAAFDD